MPSGPTRAAPQTLGANIFATQALSQQSQPEPQYRYSFLSYDTQESAAAGFPEFTQARLEQLCLCCPAHLRVAFCSPLLPISAMCAYKHCCVSCSYRLLTQSMLFAP